MHFLDPALRKANLYQTYTSFLRRKNEAHERHITPFSGSLMPKLNQTLNLAQISLSAHIIWYKLTF